MITEQDVISKYGIGGVFTTCMSLASAELYSGNENDPEVVGHITAHDIVPKDITGQMYPYDVVISMPIFPLSEGEAMEEMSHRQRMHRQNIKVTVVVFRDLEGFNKYLEDEYKYCA